MWQHLIQLTEPEKLVNQILGFLFVFYWGGGGCWCTVPSRWIRRSSMLSINPDIWWTFSRQGEVTWAMTPATSPRTDSLTSGSDKRSSRLQTPPSCERKKWLIKINCFDVSCTTCIFKTCYLLFVNDKSYTFVHCTCNFIDCWCKFLPLCTKIGTFIFCNFILS